MWPSEAPVPIVIEVMNTVKREECLEASSTVLGTCLALTVVMAVILDQNGRMVCFEPAFPFEMLGVCKVAIGSDKTQITWESQIHLVTLCCPLAFVSNMSQSRESSG